VKVSGNGAFLSMGALGGEAGRGGLFAGDPEGYVEKALQTGISLHRGPAGETGSGAHLTGTLRDG
jgi:hypothetical protein